jgi:hypothetical protein
MFNIKLYNTFNLLLLVIFLFYKNKPLFLNLNIQQIMNGCEFEEIIVFKDFDVENGIVGLE